MVFRAVLTLLIALPQTLPPVCACQPAPAKAETHAARGCCGKHRTPRDTKRAAEPVEPDPGHAPGCPAAKASVIKPEGRAAGVSPLLSLPTVESFFTSTVTSTAGLHPPLASIPFPRPPAYIAFGTRLL